MHSQNLHTVHLSHECHVIKTVPHCSYTLKPRHTHTVYNFLVDNMKHKVKVTSQLLTLSPVDMSHEQLNKYHHKQHTTTDNNNNNL
jgi:hypothetical protein